MDQERLTQVSILITTSRNPSHYVRRVTRILTFSIPRSKRITRGSLNTKNLLNYCKNLKVKRLLIIQGSKRKNTVFVKAYSIENEINLINMEIILSKITTVQKHDKTTRIMIENINLDFSKKINKAIKKKVIDFFSPILLGKNDLKGNKLLLINFEQKNPKNLIGFANQQISTKKRLLFEIEISFKCVQDE